jgi:hypothetical protein
VSWTDSRVMSDPGHTLDQRAANRVRNRPLSTERSLDQSNRANADGGRGRAVAGAGQGLDLLDLGGGAGPGAARSPRPP